MFRFHLSNYMSTIADNGIITVRPLHGMEPLFQLEHTLVEAVVVFR